MQGSLAEAIRALRPGIRPEGGPQDGKPGARVSQAWRSAAFTLLRLNPKECEALAGVFEDADAADDARLLVLDLLAGAGTFEAQVVLRRLLALAIARRDSRTFATYVQRLGILEQPDGPTLRFLMSVYAESRTETPDVRAACAYALGAAVGQAFLAGHGDAAVRASDVLRRDLLSASSVVERCALLTAIGNAGLPSDAPVILRFTSASDAPVRTAAALALRKVGTSETRGRLLAMLVDRDPRVAEGALAALAEHKMTDVEIDQLAELVLRGRTPLALDARILRLFGGYRPRHAPAPGRPGVFEKALRLLLGRADSHVPNASGERSVALNARAPSVRHAT